MLLAHSSLGDFLKTYLSTSIDSFFREIDIICEHNKINDFQEWFSERTFVSVFINAQIRGSNNGKISAIQEYLVDECKTSSKGRCDALLNFDKTLFLIESKCQKYPRKIDNSHWDMKAWEGYDDYVFKQLEWYLNAETEPNFYLDKTRYNEVYLQTMIFKVIEADKDEHFSNAYNKMDLSGPMLSKRGWYYDCYYPNAIQMGKSIGIEIYGSISRV